LCFAVDRDDRDGPVVGDAEQSLVMDTAMVAKAHDAGERCCPGNTDLPEALDDRVIKRHVLADVRFVHKEQEDLDGFSHGSPPWGRGRPGAKRAPGARTA